MPIGRLEIEPFVIQSNEVQPVVSYSRLSPNKILVETNTSEPTVLVISEAWFSGWNVQIDGYNTSIGSISNLLAVSLPTGKHTITFSYEPAAFEVGAVISLLSLLAVIAIAVPKPLWKNRKPGINPINKPG